MAGRTPAIGPDGAPISLPSEKVPELEESGGRAISPREAAIDEAAFTERDRPVTAGDVGEAALAGFHASQRGMLESAGVPLDRAITGVADLYGGDASRKSVAGYLSGLDKKYPTLTAATGLAGNVSGAVGVAAALRNPGAGLRGAGGVAARMGMGGVENVVQATTKDINEAALGDQKVNGEMLVANMPKHFLVGSLLTGAFEGGAHVLGKGVRAVTARTVPALEEGASSAVGRELGLTGDAALEQGARVRGLNEGEVPASRAGLADILTGEQATQRAAADAEHAGTVSALEGAQTTEAALLSARQEAARKTAGAQAARGVTRAEGEAGSGVWEAAATQDAKVSGAQAEGAARTMEARAAHSAAGEEALAAGDRVFEAGAAKESGVAAAIERANAKVAQVADHFGSVHSTLEAERAAALRSLEELTAEHAAATKDLQAAIRRIGDGSGGPAYVPRSAKAGSKMNYAQRPPKVGDLDVETGELWTVESLAKVAEERAASTGSEATVAEASRLTALQKSIGAAREHAQTHIEAIEKAITTNKIQARRGVRAATVEAQRETTRVAAELSAPIENASKRSGHAMRAVEDAQRRVAQVEEETKAFVEKARGEGEGAVAKAEKRGAARIASAKADAAALLKKVEEGAGKEKEALAKTHESQRAKLPQARTTTDVDPLLEGMSKRAEAPRPLLSSGAAWGAGVSLLHGNPVAAATALASGFAAGAARNHGNLIAARMMRGLSTTLTGVDAAVRDGALAVLSGRAAKVGNAIASRPGEKTPSFDELSKKIIDVQSNPAELEHRVRESVGHIAIDAPSTYQEVLATAQRANAYLYAILPVPQKDPNTLTPHLDPGFVPESARYDFMQSVRTIDDPLSLFADVSNGSITQAQVEAVQTVYPLLFDKMRNEVKRQTMFLVSPVDYEREIHVGTLLGQVTNEVLEPDFQSMMAKSYKDKSKNQESQNSAPKPSGSKATKNMMSGSESIEGGDQ